MDTYMHKTMASIANLEKIEIIRSQEFMLSEVRLKFLKKMIILGPKTAILGPQFCRILVLGPHFWWSGGPGPPGPPSGSTPAAVSCAITSHTSRHDCCYGCCCCQLLHQCQCHRHKLTSKLSAWISRDQTGKIFGILKKKFWI